jgi:sugar phosphate isomerase/epimerase
MKLSASSLSTVLVYQLIAPGKQRELNPNLGKIDIKTLIGSMKIISEIGFPFELYLDTPENVVELLKENNSAQIKRAYKDLDVRIERFYFEFLSHRILQQESPVQAEKIWLQIGALANLLEAEIVETISPPLPTDYNEFSWEKMWNGYLLAMRNYVKLAGRFGLKLAIEPRPREILSGTDSLLRFLDHIPSENLGGVVDVSHLQVAREIPAVSIRKLGKRIFSVHLSDNDGITEWHWAPGDGKIDWLPVIEALKFVGYDSLLSLDVSGLDVRHELMEGKRYIEQILAGSIDSALESRVVRSA